MVKDILYQIKFSFSKLKFNSKKETTNKLKASFGKLKDDAFDFDYIQKYFRKKDHSEAFQVLSDKTCNDLDFEDLFILLDRTHSKVGQQYLYNQLRTIVVNENKTSLNEALIKKITEDSDFRLSVQKRLDKLNRKEAYYISTLFQEEHLHPPKWFLVIKLLSFTSLISLILAFFNPIFFQDLPPSRDL